MIKKTLYLLMLVAVAFTALSGCNDSSLSTEDKEAISTYISHNNYVLDTKDPSSISILSKDASKSDVLLTGEAHSVLKNFELKLTLFKYLHDNENYNYLLTESGYASAKYLNEYVQTGDISILDMVFSQLEGTASYSKENYNFYKQLHEYNKTLTSNNKITIIGIDVEHQYSTAIKYLLSIKGIGKIKDAHLNKLKSIEGILSEGLFAKKAKLVKDIYDYIIENEDDFKEYYGSMFFDVKLVTKNIYNVCRFYLNRDNDLREQAIYENFLDVFEHYPKGKYFGQWGSEHVYQKNCGTYLGKCDRFAVRLNYDESPVKDKVITIMYAYNNCKRMDKKDKDKEYNVDYGIKNYSLLSNYVSSDYTIFKLNDENSPLNNNNAFIYKPYGGVTLDYYQYIIVINDSRGATRID